MTCGNSLVMLFLIMPRNHAHKTLTAATAHKSVYQHSYINLIKPRGKCKTEKRGNVRQKKENSPSWTALFLFAHTLLTASSNSALPIWYSSTLTANHICRTKLSMKHWHYKVRDTNDWEVFVCGLCSREGVKSTEWMNDWLTICISNCSLH